MRIALVTEFYYPHLGGVSEHVHHLALELRRRGHDATVITSNMTGQGDDPPFVRRLGTSRLMARGRVDHLNSLDTVLTAVAAILAAYQAPQLAVVGHGTLRG